MIIQLQDRRILVNMDTISAVYIPDVDTKKIIFSVTGEDEVYIAGEYNSEAAAEYMFKCIRDCLMDGTTFFFMHSADDVDDTLARRKTSEGDNVR